MKYITKVNLMIGFLLLAIGGVSLAYGLSAGPQPVEKLIVVDSRGKLVGNVVGTGIFGFETTVAFRLEGRLFVLIAHKNGFSDFSTLFFESANCTGTPYADLQVVSNNYLATVYAISGGKAYEPSGPIVNNLIVNSYLDNSAVCQSSTAQQDLFPLRLAVDLNRFFSPPFTFKSHDTEP